MCSEAEKLEEVAIVQSQTDKGLTEYLSPLCLVDCLWLPQVTLSSVMDDEIEMFFRM